jgi:hypothetical protein
VRFDWRSCGSGARRGALVSCRTLNPIAIRHDMLSSMLSRCTQQDVSGMQ